MASWGSYIADFYFDFGTKGIFGIAIYGFLIQLFSQYIEKPKADELL